MVKSAQKQTNDKTGMYVEVEFDITSPVEFTNRKFWDRFNILNKSAEASRIGKEQLAGLAFAIGIPTLNDDEQLIGHEVVMEIYVEPAKPYTDKNGVAQAGKPTNKCRKYWPVGTNVEAEKKAAKAGGHSPTVAVSSGAPAKAAWNKPAPAAAAVQAAPPPATNVAAPWKRNKA